MRLRRLIFAVFFLLPITANAEDTGNVSNDSSLSLSGVVDFSMGEVMKGMYQAMLNNYDELVKFPYDASHAWFGQPLARINLDFRPAENIIVQLGIEANIFLNTYPPERRTTASSNGGQPILPMFMDWRIHQAQGIFSLVKNDAVALDLSLGIMPYKYNPEIRNLGEFLFRSGTYPFFLVNNFNFPCARLSGLRLNLRYGSENFKVSLDQFILLEREMPPLDDISFATIAGVNVMKILEVGAGVDFARAISVNNRLTTPELAKYANGPGDTGHYTFKGIKAMARATLDPFGMSRGDKESIISQLAGENGGKIYGEIAVTGFKNYPVSTVPMERPADPRTAINQWGYTKISERMPWVVGINIPMWKILDVCAFELEKYPAPYPNDFYEASLFRGMPIPTWDYKYRGDTLPDYSTWDNPYDSAVYSMKRWYWSLYMKKKVLKQVSLLGQISRDHMRWDVNLGNMLNYTTEEIMVKPGQWSWRLGVLFEF